MSDAKLWIDEVSCTVLVKNGSAIHMMPLWAFEDMRDIIEAEAEKKVEVTHRDFDIQQELLDRYRSENAKLREYVEAAAIHSYEGGVWCDKCTFCSQCYGDEPKEHQGRGCQWLLWAHELGVEV